MYISLLSQCFVSCGSTNYSIGIFWEAFQPFSSLLWSSSCQRQAIDSRCCKRSSRLGNWSVCIHLTFTRRTVSEIVAGHRPKPLLPSSGLFQESAILHTVDTQRFCSVPFTADRANVCSLMQEYHRLFSIGF